VSQRFKMQPDWPTPLVWAEASPFLGTGHRETPRRDRSGRPAAQSRMPPAKAVKTRMSSRLPRELGVEAGAGHGVIARAYGHSGTPDVALRGRWTTSRPARSRRVSHARDANWRCRHDRGPAQSGALSPGGAAARPPGAERPRSGACGD
jgi:hypothetical protein